MTPNESVIFIKRCLLIDSDTTASALQVCGAQIPSITFTFTRTHFDHLVEVCVNNFGYQMVDNLYLKDSQGKTILQIDVINLTMVKVTLLDYHSDIIVEYVDYEYILVHRRDERYSIKRQRRTEDFNKALKDMQNTALRAAIAKAEHHCGTRSLKTSFQICSGINTTAFAKVLISARLLHPSELVTLEDSYYVPKVNAVKIIMTYGAIVEMVDDTPFLIMGMLARKKYD